MVTHVLERDIRPPHLTKPEKVCPRCGVASANTYAFFPKVRYRTQRYGPRHTTGDVCISCCSAAKSKAAVDRKQRSAEAEALAMADAQAGRYLK